MTNSRFTFIAHLAAAIAVFALAGCDGDGGRNLGQTLEATVSVVEQKTEAVSQFVVAGASEMREDVRDAAAKASDLALTASINAELAQDSELSKRKIEVSSHDGKITLRGKAPNSEARRRAAKLVAAVDGVHAVSNRMTVVSN